VGLWLAPAAAFASAVEIDGDVDCPTPDAVHAALPPGQEGRVRAHLERRERELRIEIQELDGDRTLVRTLPVDAPCAALARAAAVIINNGLVELRTGGRPLPVGEAESTASPVVAPVPVTVAGTAPLAGGARTWHLEAGAAAGAQLNGGRFGAEGSVELSFWRGTSSFAGRITIAGGPFTVEPFNGGAAAWMRLPLGVGARWRYLPAGRWFADVHAEFLNALLVIEGRGYINNQRSYGYDPALALGARLGLVLGESRRFHPFVGVTVAGWLRSQLGYVETGPSQRDHDLPRFEVLFRGGLAFESPVP
jgi:hypothetical protein